MTDTVAPACTVCAGEMNRAGTESRPYWLCAVCGNTLIDAALLTDVQPVSWSNSELAHDVLEKLRNTMRQLSDDLILVLLRRAKAAAHIAIEHYGRDYDPADARMILPPRLQMTMYAGLAAEWFIRFVNAAKNPVLLADKNHIPSLVAYAESMNDFMDSSRPYKSIGLENAVQIIRELYPSLQINRELADLASARNQAMHIGYTSSVPELSLIVDLVKVIDSLVVALGDTPDSFWEPYFADFLEAVRAPTPTAWRTTLERRLSTARRAWVDTRAANPQIDASDWIKEHQAQHEQGGVGKITPSDIVTVLRSCPVDGSLGELVVELRVGAVSADGVTVGPSDEPARDLTKEDVWAEPSFFQCFVCEVVIEHDEALEMFEEFQPFRWSTRHSHTS